VFNKKIANDLDEMVCSQGGWLFFCLSKILEIKIFQYPKFLLLLDSDDETVVEKDSSSAKLSKLSKKVLNFEI
jgi:hypothetical protein